MFCPSIQINLHIAIHFLEVKRKFFKLTEILFLFINYLIYFNILATERKIISYERKIYCQRGNFA